ncbi:hypothetical protein [Staphylococcus simulans]|uniref:hypothetical protein n=1 Tax=Staphylococcus simulans TaxID=1286 RepID=UPI00399ABB0A
MKQTFTWKAPALSAPLALDAFYLTEIWHQFEPFQDSAEHTYMLRQKRIRHHGDLIEGKAYTAELTLIDQRKLKHFTQARYTLIIKELLQNEVLIEIESTFITHTEKLTKQPLQSESQVERISKQEKQDLPSNALPLEIKWSDVETYLEAVSDYNPLHWQDYVMPGDYVVMQALNTVVPHYEEVSAYRLLDIKYKQMIMKDERLYIQVNTTDEIYHVTVYNPAHQVCVVIKVG